MTILLATNNPTDFRGHTSESTNVLHFDNTYVDKAIGRTVPQNYTGFMALDSQADVSGETEVWFHFDGYHGLTTTSAADGRLAKLNNINVETVAIMDIQDGNMRMQAIGDTTVTGSTFLMPLNNLASHDVKVSTSGGNITAEWYVDGVLMSSATAANVGGKICPNHILFEHFDLVNSGFTAYYSQFIIAAGESTIGLKVHQMAADTIGNYTTVSNDPAPLKDGLLGTGVSSNTAGQKMSWNPTAYGGPTSPTIHSVISVAQMRVGNTGPQNLRQFLRIAATDYNAPADVTPARNKAGTVIDAWTTNPATALAWTEADLATFEMGFEVKA